jgi:hypothetical protein
MKKFLFVLLLYVLFKPKQSNAFTVVNDGNLRFGIGTELLYINQDRGFYKFDEFDFIKKPYNNMKRLKISIAYKPFDNNLWIGVSTSRFVNFSIERDGYNTQNNNKVNSKENFITDGIMLGWQVNKFLPYFFINHLQAIQTIRDNQTNMILNDINKHFIVYGIGLNYTFCKNVATGIFFVFPNEKMKMNFSFGITLSASFNFDFLYKKLDN